MKSKERIFCIVVSVFFILVLLAGISTAETKKMQDLSNVNQPNPGMVNKGEEVKSNLNEAVIPKKEIINPDVVVIKYNPIMSVILPHKKHNTDEKISCNVCHHNNGGEAKCNSCHSVTEVKDKKPPLLAGRPPEGAFHTRCIGCHEKEDRGPSEPECSVCHSKE